MLPFGQFPGAYLPVKMEQSVPKRRHINFRRRGIAQKKAYKINNLFIAYEKFQNNTICTRSLGFMKKILT
jgi:hypothetical protein